MGDKRFKGESIAAFRVAQKKDESPQQVAAACCRMCGNVSAAQAYFVCTEKNGCHEVR